MNDDRTIDELGVVWEPPSLPHEDEDENGINIRNLVNEDRDEARAQYAERLRTHRHRDTDQDLILATIERATMDKLAAERRQRRAIAYAREIVPGRGYSLAAIASVAAMSPSGVRTAYSTEDVDSVRRGIAYTAKAEAPATQNEPRSQAPSIWQDTGDDGVMGLVAGAMGLDNTELRQMSTEELLAMQTNRSVDGDPKRPDQNDTQKWGEWLAIQNELNRRTDVKESN